MYRFPTWSFPAGARSNQWKITVKVVLAGPRGQASRCGSCSSAASDLCWSSVSLACGMYVARA